MDEKILAALTAAFSPFATQFERMIALLTLAAPKARRPSQSSTLEKQRDIRRGRCNLFYATLTVTSGANNYYLLLLDKDGAAVDGDIPKVVGPLVVPGDIRSLDYEGGRLFEQGCIAVASLTPDYVTLPSDRVCWFDSQIEA